MPEFLLYLEIKAISLTIYQGKNCLAFQYDCFLIYKVLYMTGCHILETEKKKTFPRSVVKVSYVRCDEYVSMHY